MAVLRQNRRIGATAMLVGLTVAISAGTAVGAVAASRTREDIKSAASAEAKVLSLLDHYQATPAWRRQFNAAFATQSAWLGKVRADVSGNGGSKPPGTSSNTLRFQDDNGVPYSVALLSIVDPAQPASSFDAASPGDRLIATEFKITDLSASKPASDDANDDASVVGSNDQTYQSGLSSVAGCTDFSDGEFQLGPGQSTTGCVEFELKDGIRVTYVKWSADAGFGSFGAWKVR